MAGADWLDDVAAALGVDGLDDDEVELLLDMARDVAHGTERRFAPLSCFLVGLAAGRDRPALAGLARRVAELARSDGPAGVG